MRADRHTLLLEPQLAQRTGKHQRSRQSAGEMAAAARVVAGIVAQHTRVVRVTGTRLSRQLGVVVRALIGVADDGTDRRARRFTIVDAGLNFRPVRLLTRGGLLVAARCAALHLAQDKRLVIQ